MERSQPAKRKKKDSKASKESEKDKQVVVERPPRPDPVDNWERAQYMLDDTFDFLKRQETTHLLLVLVFFFLFMVFWRLGNVKNMLYEQRNA